MPRTAKCLAFLILSALVLPGLFKPAQAGPPGDVPPGQSKKWEGRQGHGRHDMRGGGGPGLGPPDHAPAHGYRRKHEYRYYPDQNVYYDPDRSIYFFEQEGRWIRTPEPPPLLELDLGGGISLELDTDSPFEYNIQHRQRYR